MLDNNVIKYILCFGDTYNVMYPDISKIYYLSFLSKSRGRLKLGYNNDCVCVEVIQNKP